MPKLLFLAYPFPPSPAIGAVRAWSMAKYLSRQGWKVTVVTPRPAAGFSPEVLANVDDQCRAEGIRRLFVGRLLWESPRSNRWEQPGVWLRHLPRRIAGLLWRAMGIGWDEVWAASCFRVLDGLKPGAYDLVLATGSPFSSFLTARWVARKLCIPYVLDYRDPWTLNNLRSRPWPSYVHRLELAIVEDAAAILMVSPSQAAAQARAFGLAVPPVVLTNGYDPEQLAKVTAVQFDHFALVYAGEFYPGQREIDPVLLAIGCAHERMPSSQLPIRLHYYGSASQQVRVKAREYGVEDLVECHGLVSREQALAAVKGSSVTLVIAGIADTASEVERGIVTGKLFEPLGLGIRILLVAPAGSDATAMVVAAGAGKSFRATEIDAMAAWLINCATRKGHQGFPPPVDYAWNALAQRLAEILGGCLVPNGVAVNGRYPDS